MIPIAKPHISEEEIDAVSAVLRSGMIAEGENTREFENVFAEYTGVEHAIAVNSGTAALHVALLAHDIGRGDEVITSSFSFIATANSIMYTGAKPVFADIKTDTFNLDAEKIEEKITPDTKAIMPVHLYGHPADMKAVMDIAEDHDLVVIEDACQAHGAAYDGKRVGSFGTGGFSFYPTKNMTTSEGGMVTTNDETIAQKARMIKAHGSSQRYVHDMIGYNYRMTNIAAAIGLVQMDRLESYIERRQDNAHMLTAGLKAFDGITTPIVRPGCQHVFHQYTIRVDNRDEVVDQLNKNGVGTGVYYPIPIHKQPLYIAEGFKDTLPVCEKACEEVISLPVHPAVTEDDVRTIINVFGEILG